MSQRSLFSLLSIAILFFSSILICVWFNLSFLLTLIIPLFITAGLLIIWSPLWFLSGLLILRMSLDILGDTLSISINQTFSLSLSQGIGIAIVLLSILAFFKHKMPRSALKLTTPIGIILLWGAFSFFFSFSSFDTLRELLRIFDTIFLALLAFVAITTRKQFSFLLKSILVSSIIPCLIGIYQYVNGIGFTDDAVSIPRIYGTFSHPNIFSLYLFTLIVITLLLFLIRTHKNSPLQALFLLFLGGFFLAMLLITYTRVAWVILFLFFLLLALARFRILLFPLIVFPIFLYVFVLPLQERIDSMFQSDPGSSITWRRAMWKLSIQKTLSENKTILGYGLNTFPLVAVELPDPTLGSNEAHNDFVKFFVEGGIVGLAAYLAYLSTLSLSLFKKTWSLRDQSQKLPYIVFLILSAFWICLIFASLSDNIFKNTPVQWIFWILLAASWRVFGTAPASRQKA